MSRRGYVPLYVKQKKFLTDLFLSTGARSVDDLPGAQWNKLQDMHDTETLYQDANRFLSDLAFNQAYRPDELSVDADARLRKSLAKTIP